LTVGRLRIGKVPPQTLLKSVYPFLGRKSRSLLIGPGIGRDSAAIRYGDKVLVFSTDPITGTATGIGEHSLIINANDVATAGARPVWYLCAILLPPGTVEPALRSLMADIDRAARTLGITVVGGHTEITPGLTRPIIAGFMVGESRAMKVLSSEGGMDGDLVLLTRTAGLEGTSIIASDYAERLKKLPTKTLKRARSFSSQMSVVNEALGVARVRGVHAMHDPTEGGVLNGLWELAEASGLGIEAWADKVPIAPETMQICTRLRLDPLRLMSSGSLLIALESSALGRAVRVLGKGRVRVSTVGRLVSRKRGRYVVRKGRRLELKAVPRDELYRLA
jgi:hydrogenase maturation factor